MIKEASLDALQRKLGTFLSLSYDAGISMDVMDDAFLRNPYFDFLEENRADEFLNDSYDDIAKKIYGASLRLDENGAVNTKLFWVGFSYVDLSSRIKRPLRQLFLLVPPSEMVTLFEPYHEMSEEALSTYFEQEIYKRRSVLKKLLKLRRMSVPSLAYYCGCSVPLIWSYCISNDHLFAASGRIVSSIAEALGVSLNLIKERSSFIYYSSSFLLDEGFIGLLGESLKSIVGLKKIEGPFVYVNARDIASSLESKGKTAIMVTYLPIDLCVIKKIVNHFGSLIVIGPVSIYYEAKPKGAKKKILNQDLVDLAFKYACKKNSLM